MAKSVRTYTASDYAGLQVGDHQHEFYYGYEYDSDAEGAIWGFFVTWEGTRLWGVPYTQMAQHPGCPDQFETQDCLLFGIGLWLAIGKEQS